MGAVIGFMLFRFAIVGGGLVLLLALLGTVALMLRKAGRLDRVRQIVEPVVRNELSSVRSRIHR